jgi:hypothetical protein
VINASEEIATITTEDVERAFVEILAGRRPNLSQMEEENVQIEKINKKLRNSVRILQKGTFSL